MTETNLLILSQLFTSLPTKVIINVYTDYNGNKIC